MTKQIYRYLFWISIAGLIIVSSLPNDEIVKNINNAEHVFRIDYLLHFIAYSVIGSLAFLAYKPAIKPLILLIIFSILEEGHQHWIPTRTLNPYDFLFDVLGLVVSFFTVYFYQYFKKSV